MGDFVAVDQLGVLKGRRPEGEDVPDKLSVHLDLLDVLLGIVVEAGQAVIVRSDPAPPPFQSGTRSTKESNTSDGTLAFLQEDA